MTAEQAVFAALSTLAPLGGVWGNTAKDADILPHIIYSRVSGVPDNPLAGGAPAWAYVRLQIDCYDSQYGLVKALAEQVKAAMVTLQATVPNWPLNEMDLYEQEVKQHRVTLDYGVRG